jgi:hypothetical protein
MNRARERSLPGPLLSRQPSKRGPLERSDLFQRPLFAVERWDT